MFTGVNSRIAAVWLFSPGANRHPFKNKGCHKCDKIPTGVTSGCHYLTVTLGSWVTPQVMTALVPLMTLWSCGGLVMRVRAANTHRGCYSETVFEQRIAQSLLDSVSSITHCLVRNWVNHVTSFQWVEYFARLSRTDNLNLCTENECTHESLDYIFSISWQWPPATRYLLHLQVNMSWSKKNKDVCFYFFIFSRVWAWTWSLQDFPQVLDKVENEYMQESLDYIFRTSWQWPPGSRFLHLQVNKSWIKKKQPLYFLGVMQSFPHVLWTG